MANTAPDPPAVVWFRQDLRVADNPALAAAAASGRPLLPLYILDDDSAGEWAPGGAARWWLHHSLAALAGRLAGLGVPLVLRTGVATQVVPRLVDEAGARSVFWNRRVEPFASAQDAAIAARLRARAVTVETFNAALLHEPERLRPKGGGEYFKVFTPFWKACLRLPPPEPPAPAPRPLRAPARASAGEALESWRLLPATPERAAGFEALWQPGEAGARLRLEAVLADGLENYAAGRDRPDQAATSRLSPHLHWGEIGPRQVWHAVEAWAQQGKRDGRTKAAEAFLRQLAWREFSHHLLVHFPDLPWRNFRAEFDALAWRNDGRHLAAWQRGRTGYPLVDAGLRELWATGWMHNRVRMIAASFLVKHLLIDWRAGARWFWDTLVDADLANNSASWQWVAGSGADAAPYFRIFNPVLQGERFDAKGRYVRHWVPELRALPERFVHKPWAAPAAVLRQAGVALGETYPRPIVDHAAARARALHAFKAMRG